MSDKIILPPGVAEALEAEVRFERMREEARARRKVSDRTFVKLAEPVHKLSEDERRARRGKNHLKAVKAAKRRSGGSRGMSTWKPRAKRIGKVARIEQREHGYSKQEARELAKKGQAIIDYYTPKG